MSFNALRSSRADRLAQPALRPLVSAMNSLMSIGSPVKIRGGAVFEPCAPSARATLRISSSFANAQTLEDVPPRIALPDCSLELEHHPGARLSSSQQSRFGQRI